MNIYCVFCEPGKARFVASAAKACFGCETISPTTIQHTWKKGQMTDVERELLPNYVFLYFREGRPGYDRLSYMQGVIRCLRSSDRDEYELAGEDREFAMMLGKTRVYQEGDRIRISEGNFAGLKTEIRKVDHRNHRMQIEIPFAGRMVRTWVEYETIEPAEAPLNQETQEVHHGRQN